MIRYIPFVIATALLSACGNSKNTTTRESSTVTRKSIVCGSKHTAGKHIDWYAVDTSTVSFPKEFKAPTGYQLFTLDTTQLNEFFYNSGRAWQTSIPLPEPIGCQVTMLKESSAMSPELRMKYPKMVSLQGGIDGQANADVRLNYDGRRMHGQITWNGEHYIINPVESGKDRYYMIYGKKNTTVPKRGFEQQFKKTKLPTYDR